MSYNFIFGGTNLSSLYGVTTSRPPIEIAEYDGELRSIPGCNGDEYIDNHRYKNVIFTREIGIIKRQSGNTYAIVENLIQWLAYSHGYQSFEDSDHPGMVTYAVLTNFNEVQIQLRRIHKAKLKFSRVPFWYLKTGTSEQHYTYAEIRDSVQMVNPYILESKPIIRAELIVIQTTSQIDFDIDINGVSITVGVIRRQAYENSSLIIDTEKQLVYVRNNSTGEKRMQNIDVPSNFCFSQGTNTITVTRRTSTSTDFYITPRWRCL